MKCIYHAYISHVSRYSLDQKKVSSRSRLGHSRVFGKRLGLVSVSGAQVSVSVSTQMVLGPPLVIQTYYIQVYCVLVHSSLLLAFKFSLLHALLIHLLG